MKKVISILAVLTISMTSLVYADIGNEKNVKIEDNIQTINNVIDERGPIKSIKPISKAKVASELEEDPVFEQEPNNTYDKANKIDLEDSVIGEFGIYPDLDYFKFTVTELGELYLLGNVSDTFYNPHLRIGLLDSDGKTVISASNLINSSGGTYQVMQEQLPPGDYYIVVYQDYTVAKADQIYSTIYSFITDFTPEATETPDIPEDNTGDYRILESKTNVPVDKVWSVKFNLPIDKNTIKEKNIYVTDSSGNIMTMLYTQDKGIDNTIYLMPGKDYLKGGKYTLWIKDLSGTKGQKLKQYVKMDFTIIK